MSDHPPHPAASGPPASGPVPGHAAGSPGDGAGNGTPPTRYLCPYCGQVTADARRCSSCGGHLDPLSRQATQNTMGPWQIHDAASPFRPGCSFVTVRKLIQKGQITRRTILRGPTTRQFWTFADRTPSVANLLGVCHNCHAEVAPEAFLCAACGASFTPETDRQYLGLAPRRPLPGEAPPDQVAHMASDGPGLHTEPRRPAAEDAGAPPGPEAMGRRVQRPAFPADPRPPRQKRSPLAVIALVAVAGVIGLSLGAAGALAVAWSVGMIDLTPDDPEGEVAPPPSRGDGWVPPPARGAAAGQAPEPGEAPAGADRAGSNGPEAGSDPGAPLPEAPESHSDSPPPDSAPPDSPPPEPPAAEPLPEPTPAVPPRLRRLP